jgi:hypothetical protein
MSILCGSLAHHPSSVVIDKSDRPTVLVDSLLDKICVEEKKQDRRQGKTLWQPSLLKFAHLGCQAIRYDRGCTSGAKGIDPPRQV